jgi:hypothetical protein
MRKMKRWMQRIERNGAEKRVKQNEAVCSKVLQKGVASAKSGMVLGGRAIEDVAAPPAPPAAAVVRVC